MSKHTPGPWTNEDYEIVAEDGSVICSVKDINSFPCIDQDNDETQMRQLVAEFQANARLIAAAPRLLVALQELKRGDCWCEVGIGNPMMNGHSAACIEARSAIAQATEAR